MRLGDLDALKEKFKSRLADCNEWIEKAKDKETKIRASAVKAFIGEVIMTINNATTVDNPYQEGYIDGVLQAEKLYAKPLDEWIPVSERLPDDLEPVNITWINHCPEPYYKEIKDKPFTATGVYFNGQWYWWSTLCADTLAEYSHNFDDVIDGAIEVIAWMPLPEPYKKEGDKE